MSQNSLQIKTIIDTPARVRSEYLLELRRLLHLEVHHFAASVLHGYGDGGLGGSGISLVALTTAMLLGASVDLIAVLHLQHFRGLVAKNLYMLIDKADILALNALPEKKKQQFKSKRK